MKRLAIAVLVGASLGACSTTPPAPAQPEFNGDLVQVSLQELESYWTVIPKSQADARRSVRMLTHPCRKALLAFTVDSTGRVFDVEIVDAWPNEAAVTDFVQMQRRFRYEATPANADHTPVRSVTTRSGFIRGTECKFPEMNEQSWRDGANHQ